MSQESVNNRAPSTAEQIDKVCDSLKSLLQAKNANYGDAALNPFHIFWKGDASDTLGKRMDEKLARIKNSDILRENDVVDIAGYAMLICIKNGWTNFNHLID